MQASKYTKFLKNKWFRRTACVFTATSFTVGVVAVSLSYTPASAAGLTLHPPNYPWYHKNWLHSFDHASIRRGYQVYKQVCAACHSVEYICYRHLIGVCFTEEEAMAEAAEAIILDGPDADGNMFERPGLLRDFFPSPYKCEEEARKANNGSYPPDFTSLVLAREGHEDYIFQILTGYCDPPAGIVLEDGQYYNPYFSGSVIGMAKALYNEAIEFDDGTPATVSQMAKDVTTFMTWVADPSHDERKFVGIRVVPILVLSLFILYYLKRSSWSYYYSMQMVYKNRKPPKIL